MGCSRDDYGSASFERASEELVWAGHTVKDIEMRMEFSLPGIGYLKAIRHIRTVHYSPGLYRVEYTISEQPNESTNWTASEPGDETWANAYHMRLATAARAAQVFKPTITETTRI